jgi:glycosyltransferase involved in cell wall biosynthesis
MISVMIPAYNEEENLQLTFDNVLKAARDAGDIPLEFIIVNDASTDRTGVIADRLAAEHSMVRIIHNPVNLGIGSGFRAALQVAKYPKYMIVAGDNDIPADMMALMMRHHDKADLILGYWLNKEDRGRKRNVLSTLYNTIYMIVFDVFIQYLNGPIIFPTDILRRFEIKSRRFSITAEATIKCLRYGCSFCEFPGHMQTGLKGSTSIALRNLVETFSTFLKLAVEIGLTNREMFAKRPKRVRIDVDQQIPSARG